MHRGKKNETELYRFLLAIKPVDNEIKDYKEKRENPT